MKYPKNVMVWYTNSDDFVVHSCTSVGDLRRKVALHHERLPTEIRLFDERNGPLLNDCAAPPSKVSLILKNEPKYKEDQWMAALAGRLKTNESGGEDRLLSDLGSHPSPGMKHWIEGALWHAVDSEPHNVCSALLRLGADPNAMGHPFYSPPLHELLATIHKMHFYHRIFP